MIFGAHQRALILLSPSFSIFPFPTIPARSNQAGHACPPSCPGSPICDSREFPPKQSPSGWWGDGEPEQEPVPKPCFFSLIQRRLLLLGSRSCGSKVSAPGPGSHTPQALEPVARLGNRLQAVTSPAPLFCLESTEHEMIQSDYIITAPPLLLFAGFIFSFSSRFFTNAVQHHFRFACTTAATRGAAGSGTRRPDSPKRSRRGRKIPSLLFPLMRLKSF